MGTREDAAKRYSYVSGLDSWREGNMAEKNEIEKKRGAWWNKC